MSERILKSLTDSELDQKLDELQKIAVIPASKADKLRSLQIEAVTNEIMSRW